MRKSNESSEYALKNRIFKGNKSSIYRAEYGGNPVILKILNAEYPDVADLKRIDNEYKCLDKLKDVKGVINGLDFVKFNNGNAIVMEEYDFVSLADFINESPVSIATFLKISISITSTLKQIHNAQIIHKDLNPRNILINPENMQTKIIDFGMSSGFSQEAIQPLYPESIEGTLLYISPEQTGRIKKTIDYRSDFYSLGITFYEMLTGFPPFYSKSPLEIVHSHLAKTPEPPDYMNKKIPKAISAIVMKLLEKTAEDRYQSAAGILSDLNSCMEMRNKKQPIPYFDPGNNDIPIMLVIPEKLYGRETEVEFLFDSYKKCINGKKQIVFLSGYSGIGKSVLVNEIRKPVLKENGWYVSGKYEELKKDIPYSAIVHLFNDLIQQVLSKEEKELAEWKDRILDAVQGNGKVVTDIIPEMKLIIGTQPETEHLSAQELLNRFRHIFCNLISIFAQSSQPLVFFLDDMQWADDSSLSLLEALLLDKSLSNLLFIFSYRSNEVDKDHQLFRIRGLLDNAGIAWTEMKLNKLMKKDVADLLADTFRVSRKEAGDLAELINLKTDGNPFYIIQYLKILYEKELIALDRRWNWDTERIRELTVTDSMADMISNRFNNLERECQQLISIASCIGSEFTIELLALVSEKTRETCKELIDTAVNAGLVVNVQSQYRFIHDKVKEAAYLLLGVDRQRSLNFKIGRILLDKNEDNISVYLFRITNHLNESKDILNENDRNRLLELNMQAGDKAKGSTAYSAAVKFYKHAIILFPENPWCSLYQKTLHIYTELSESCYLAGQIDEAEQLFSAVLENAQSVDDKIKIYSIKISHFTMQNQHAKALETGKTVLKMLGENINDSLSVEIEIGEISELLEKRNPSDLLDLPLLADKSKIAIMNLMEQCIAAAFYTDQLLMTILVLRIMKYSLIYGHNEYSPYSYAFYGLILNTSGDINTGYEFCKLGVRLAEKLNVKKAIGRSLYLYGLLAGVFCSLEEGRNAVWKGYSNCIASGDNEFAAYNMQYFTIFDLIMGKPLQELANEALGNLFKIAALKNKTSITIQRLITKVVLSCLRGMISPETMLDDDKAIDDADAKEIFIEDSKVRMSVYYSFKPLVMIIFEKYSRIHDYNEKLNEYLPFLMGTSAYYISEYYRAVNLAILILKNKNTNKNNNNEDVNTINEVQQLMEKMEISFPEYYKHKRLLLQAFIADINGDFKEAAVLFDKASIEVSKSTFIIDEAITNECAGIFYSENGLENVALNHIRKARYCYNGWGCIPKVKMIDQANPTIKTVLNVSAADERIINGKIYYAHGEIVTPDSKSSSGEVLDLGTVIKSSYLLAGEMNMKILMNKIIRIMIENAGAQKGIMILPDKSGFLIQAEAYADSEKVKVMQAMPLDESYNIPAGIVNYVARTAKTIVLDDAAKSEQFGNEEYIKDNNIRSLLCIPVLNQGKLSGILYLENNLSVGAFTIQRVDMLNLLSVQAAISIENAKIQEQNSRLITMQKEAMTRVENSLNEKKILLNEIHHRVKNNMQVIIGLMDLQLAKADNEKCTNMFQAIHSRIQAMALVHEELFDSESFSKVNLSSYLQNLCVQLAMLYDIPSDRFNYHIEIPDKVIKLEKAVPLGLALNELVTNSIKYANNESYKTIITIRSEEAGEDKIRIIISDNGRGLSADMKIRKDTMSGLNLVKILIEDQLDGKMDIVFGKTGNVILTLPGDIFTE